MKFFPLVLANLGRHKRRVFLTISSVALALFLFASLRTVVTTLARAAQFGSAKRLVVTNATGLVFPLPLSYANRLKADKGIEAVTWANWFGGRYGDGKRFFAQFAVDPTSYLAMYPEITLPEDQKQAFIRERSSAIVGRRLLDVFGWKVGQNVTILGTIFPGEWTFTIRGAYTPSDPVINDDMMLFHHEYLEEKDVPAWQAGTSCRSPIPTTPPGSARWWTTSSGTPAPPPRPVPSRPSTPALPRCGGT
jgi:putative ABC transport system permease protein